MARHICIKAILFLQWGEYTVNRSDLQHVHNKFTCVSATFFPGCFKRAVHLHSKFAYVHMYASRANNLGSTNFREQTNSLSGLVPQPWEGTQRCHAAVSQVCPISSLCSLGHHWIPAQQNGGSFCPFFQSLSTGVLGTVNVTPSAIALYEWCHDANTGSTTASL